MYGIQEKKLKYSNNKLTVGKRTRKYGKSDDCGKPM